MLATAPHPASRRAFDPAYLVYRHLLIPGYEGLWQRRRTFAIWRELERTQWLTPAALANLQFDALARLVAHAGATAPFFRTTWAREGIGPHTLRTPDDLQRFPLTTRDSIRANRAEMRSTRPAGRVRSKRTGGSTGTTLEFDYDDQSLERRMAAAHRGYRWAGAEPGTRQFYFWGAAPIRSRRQRTKDWLYQRLYRRTFVNTYFYRDDEATRYYAMLNRLRPDVIVAFTNPLFALARAFDELGRRPPPPHAIVVGGEQLHDMQRSTIERVFQAPVFETYGSREFMLIGAECDRHAGLHLTTENLLVEVLEDDGSPTPAGREGNVVVTDLYNYALPFIRYVTGDRAVAGVSVCSCGRGLPLLPRITGRTLDLLVTPDGRRVAGEFFVQALGLHKNVRRYQVVQPTENRLVVRVVLAPGANDEDPAAIEREIRHVFGDRMHIAIEIVDDIPLTATGKLQVVVNEWLRARGAASR